MKILNKIKKNWFVLILILAVLVVSTVMNNEEKIYAVGEPLLYDDMDYYMAKSSGMVKERIIASEPYPGDDFAPEVEERQIEKNAYMSLEVKRGNFKDVENELIALVKATDSFVLNQNVNKYDESYRGSYTVKVNNEKYEFFILQAKEFGNVLSFVPSAREAARNHEPALVRRRFAFLHGDFTKINLPRKSVC